MEQTTDNSNAVVYPQMAWALAVVVGFGLNWLYPMPFVPAFLPATWVGCAIFVLGLMLGIWAMRIIRIAGTPVECDKPTTTVVTGGPYGFSRNPIYAGMFLGHISLAVGFNNLWLIATLVPFYLVIRYGVIAREEIYLEHKFSAVYVNYRSRVRRWL